MGEKTTYMDIKKVEHKGEIYQVPVIKFLPYKDITWLNHGFSTRQGGVSEGMFATLNLSFSRGDDLEKVMTNHQIMAKALQTDLEHMVYSYQTHTINVMEITKEHMGMGFTKERSFGEVDGFVTNVPGIMLVTAYADCTPLYFTDMKQHAIGLSHSGWRGTLHNMAQATINKMKECYGTAPEDIRAFIGPSICRNCYEVGEDVAGQFVEAYRESGLVHGRREDVDFIVSEKEIQPDGSKKYYLNLPAANRLNLLKAGIKEENISISDLCTCCNPELLFSHRASKGKRGGLCGYMGITEV